MHVKRVQQLGPSSAAFEVHKQELDQKWNSSDSNQQPYWMLARGLTCDVIVLATFPVFLMDCSFMIGSSV